MSFFLSWIACFRSGEERVEVEPERIEALPLSRDVKTKKVYKSIPSKVRVEVWRLYNGESEVGICYVCGVKITKTDWHCAHVVADADGGNPTVRNLRPSCKKCNLSMGKINLYAYILKYDKKGPGRSNADKYIESHPRARKTRGRKKGVTKARTKKEEKTE